MCKYKESSKYKFDKFNTNSNKSLIYSYLNNNTKFWKARNSIIRNFFHNNLKPWFYDLSELRGICLFMIPFLPSLKLLFYFCPIPKFQIYWSLASFFLALHIFRILTPVTCGVRQLSNSFVFVLNGGLKH